MLRAAAIFLVLAIIAAVFSFGISVPVTSFLTKTLFLVLLLLFMVTLTLGVIRSNGHSDHQDRPLDSSERTRH